MEDALEGNPNVIAAVAGLRVVGLNFFASSFIPQDDDPAVLIPDEDGIDHDERVGRVRPRSVVLGGGNDDGGAALRSSTRTLSILAVESSTF